jgi:hypothetical protein
LYCSSLESVNIPSSVTIIERGAFGGCSNLESVNIPPSVESIQGRAFQYCYKLTNIKISRSTTVEDGAFDEQVRIDRY